MVARTRLNVRSVVHCLSFDVTSLISFFLYFEMQGLTTVYLVHCNREMNLYEKFSFSTSKPSPDSEGLYQVSEK